jgi:hypothetical protein
MKDFFVMIGHRIRKLIATILSIPFLMLLIAVYVQMDNIYIFAIIITMLTKRQIDKIKGLGYFGKDKEQ